MKLFSDHINKFRVREGQMKSDDDYGITGAWRIPLPCGEQAFVISTDGVGSYPRWEHVSVSLPKRCLTWQEMCFIKELFWKDDEAVMQLHPPKQDWVNNHDFCLHLWRPFEDSIPLPPAILVGVK